MFSILKSGLLSLSLGASLLLVGCQSAAPQMPASHEMASNAVMCDKCQMVWVRNANSGGGKGRPMAYSWAQKMECPDCTDAVSNFFATGNLKHECKACGGNMTICEQH